MSARPVKCAEDKRTNAVRLYLSDKEKEELLRIASSHGYNGYDLSEYLRRVSLGYLAVDRQKAGLDT
jgi:hypothetical protein